MMATDHPEPPSPPPTLLEQYGNSLELMYRYGIEIVNGEAHKRALAEMLAHMKK